MKLKFVIAAVAASVLAACSEPTIDEPVKAEETVNLNIALSACETKVVDDDREATINGYQLFVFGDGGVLENYKNVSGTTQISIGAFGGHKLIYALANAPSMSDVMDYADFCSRRSSIQDNLLEKMVMQGFTTVDVDGKDMELVIPVERMVAKVSLVNVKNELDTYYREFEFVLRRAYLINVAGDLPYGHSEDVDRAPTTWYNWRQFNATDNLTSLTSGSYDKIMVYGQSAPHQHHFYCYPNPTEEDAYSDDRTPRRTRLVVEIELDGKTYYYPVTMPVLEQNTEYKVTLTVKGLGSDNPDRPYHSNVAKVSIEVEDWYDGGAIDERI